MDSANRRNQPDVATTKRKTKHGNQRKRKEFKLGDRLEVKRPLDWDYAALHGTGCRALARLLSNRAHFGSSRRRKALGPSPERVLCSSPRRGDGEPGRPAGESWTEGYLRKRLAGCGRRQRCRADVP